MVVPHREAASDVGCEPAEVSARAPADWFQSFKPSGARMGVEARSLFERRFDRAHAVSAYAESLKRCLSGAPRRLHTSGRVRPYEQGN